MKYKLSVSANKSYVILMKLDKSSTMTSPEGAVKHPAKELVRLTNPASIDMIYGLVELFNKANKTEEDE